MSSTQSPSSGAANETEAEAAVKRLAVDPLGYAVYAETLWQRVRHALDRDGPKDELGDDPLVVGIFGEWGAGKSYLLDKIYREAKKHQRELSLRRQNDGGFHLTIPVSFQPWKYEHEEHLHVPLLLHILAALDEGLKEARTGWERTLEAAQKPGDTIIRALPKVLGLMKNAVVGAGAALAPVQALAERVAADATARSKSAKPKTADQLKYSGDGRYFHEIHKVLKAVTRPGKYDHLHGRILRNDEFRTNFVIFVDDLDRCLPEKAVAVLELIKTIFNVESFAFVLALDDEVIERGIGHRYKEYALVNKKPQMPITGFEYLEKIVHLPFRLPALTRAQAITFVRAIELRVESNSDLRWFSASATATRSLSETSGREIKKRSLEDELQEIGDSWRRAAAPSANLMTASEQLEPALLRLLLASFDAYVPRKLLRAVELWHQICRVARARGIAQPTGTAASWQRVHEGGNVSIDTRVVFALAVLQLFQPELFRFMRRRVEAFPVLLRSMAGSTAAADGLNKVECSDVDLWSWASFREGEKDKAAIKRPFTEEAAVVLIATLSSENAYQAQHIRLRLAERLVEHFTVQRHVFNPLHLMHWLAQELPPTEVATFNDLPAYFGVLAQQSELTIAIEKPPTQGIDPGAGLSDL